MDIILLGVRLGVAVILAHFLSTSILSIGNENITLKIGFSYDPDPSLDRLLYNCETQTDQATSILIAQEFPLCNSSLFGDFLDCILSEDNVPYFAIELEFLNSGERFRSGLNVENGFFIVDKVERLHFDGPRGNITSFDFLLEGLFNVTLHKAGLNSANSNDSITVGNSGFKIGLWELN